MDSTAIGSDAARRLPEDPAQVQLGIVSRSQLLEAGVTPAQIKAQLQARRWQRVHRGIYAMYTGPLPAQALIWAAVLSGGAGAAVTGRTALWLFGVIDRPAVLIDVCVPHGRKAAPRPGVRLRSARDLGRRLHPTAQPPRVRLEHALLDELDTLSAPGDVVGLLIRAVQSRATTADRVTSAMRGRPRCRWRRLTREVLGDVTQGAQSALERRYLIGVERAHGLPRGSRNQGETDRGGRTVYRDVRYRRWRLVVELDGAEAHPAHLAHRDRFRDNATTLSHERPLRYGWYEVVQVPCLVAGQVAEGLRLGGWGGTVRRCGPHCTG